MQVVKGIGQYRILDLEDLVLAAAIRLDESLDETPAAALGIEDSAATGKQPEAGSDRELVKLQLASIYARINSAATGTTIASPYSLKRPTRASAVSGSSLPGSRSNPTSPELPEASGSTPR
jgi:hypothetical protein